MNDKLIENTLNCLYKLSKVYRLNSMKQLITELEQIYEERNPQADENKINIYLDYQQRIKELR